MNRLECPYTCNTTDAINCKNCERGLIVLSLIEEAKIEDYKKKIKQYTPSYEEEKDSINRLNAIKNDISSFIKEGQNLIISSTGPITGKTSWSVKLMCKYFDEVWMYKNYVVRGFFLSVPDFLHNMKSYKYRDDEEYLNIEYCIKNADLVIWDEFFTNKLSESEQKLLNTLLSMRLNRGKANIFNGIEPEDIEEYLGYKLSCLYKKYENIQIIDINKEDE